MTAFATITDKTGTGRDTRQPKGARHVEDQECAPGVTHRLANTPAGVTRCVHCRETWSALDAALREPEPPIPGDICQECSRIVIPRAKWRKADQLQRASWVRNGKRQKVGELCQTCYQRGRDGVVA